MPYIITTKEPVLYPGEAVMIREGVTSRRAVATLDEARRGVYQHVISVAPGVNHMALAQRSLDLPEQGGTVGPLPDGTVIEVERTEWRTLAVAGSIPNVPEDEKQVHATIKSTRIIAAYNAAQEGR